jgi:hypothetical protein
VTGPYTSVNCTLTLLKSSIRKESTLSGDEYARTGSDTRFSDHFGSLQSIVTSTAQNDSGLFETNVHDERYLPFEGSGVISEWSIELSGKWTADGEVTELAQFDFDTISDVILHLRYTARDGGGLLRRGAIDNLETRIAASQGPGSVRLFSVRHEFPTEWARFKGIRLPEAGPVAELALTFREEHYPYWSKGRLGSIEQVEVIVKTDRQPLNVTYEPDGGETSDPVQSRLGDLRRGTLSHFPMETPVGRVALYFDDNAMDELWLAVTWR